MSEDDIERMRGELLFLRKTVRILAAVQELSDRMPKPVIKSKISSQEPVAWAVYFFQPPPFLYRIYHTEREAVAVCDAMNRDGITHDPMAEVVPLYGTPQECPHVRGTVTQHCSLNFSLTDEERAAIEQAVKWYDNMRAASTLRALLERLK